MALARVLLQRDDVRLLTLSGPGGVGKTRLAIKIAGEMGELFGDGVRFVELAAVTSDDQVVTTVAHAFGLVATGDSPALDALADHLRESDLLLVIDNVEHVIQGAVVLSDLLAECPRLKILITSRTLLRFAGEQALPVPPLDLFVDRQHSSTEEIANSAAVALFVDRARAVLPWFELTPELAPVVAEICRHMDGLPLGIELAAAQIRVIAPEQLLERLRAHLPLPLSGPRDAPMRLRTVRDAVAWSYGLLTAEEQSLFRSLGVFVGGFGLDAAASIAGTTSEMMFERVVALVDKSLVRQETWEEASWVGEPRFSMLETIRGFALEQLSASGDEDAVRDAHAAWCLRLAEENRFRPYLPSGQQGLRRLEVEHANLRAALDWLDRRNDRERLLRMATALGRFWFAHGHYEEGRQWLERALRDPEGFAPPARAWAQVELGQITYARGDRERGEQLLERSIEAAREQGDVMLLTSALIAQSRTLIAHAQFDQAEGALREALSGAMSIPDPGVAASNTVRVQAHLGVVAHERGDLATARAWHERALHSYRELGDVLGSIRSLRDIGDVACDQGEYAVALDAYRESLALLGKWGDPFVVINALTGSGLVAAEWRQPERAARLLGAAEAAREQYHLGVILPSEEGVLRRAIALVREAIGTPAMRAAWQIGRGFSLAEAIAEVQALTPLAGTAQHAADRSALGLSPREEEVLGFLVTGQSNREIADTLFISVRTAEGHVANLLAKLGVRTRAEAVKVAAAAGIPPRGATDSAPHN